MFASVRTSSYRWPLAWADRSMAIASETLAATEGRSRQLQSISSRIKRLVALSSTINTRVPSMIARRAGRLLREGAVADTPNVAVK